MQRFLFLTLLLVNVCLDAHGQQSQSQEPTKIEVGVHTSLLNIGSQIDPFIPLTDHARPEAGIGVRFSYNLSRSVALEAETNFFPRENFPELNSGGRLFQGQFGVKAGKRFNRFGLFAKARPGFLSFGQILTQTGSVTFPFQGNGPIVTFPILEPQRRNFFSLDVGAVVEFYPSRRFLARLDLGDTMVHYSETPVVPFFGASPPKRLGHKFQFSSGIAFRFLNPESTADHAPPTSPGERKFEIGVQFSTLHLEEFFYTFSNTGITSEIGLASPANTQASGGIRLTYNFSPIVAAEVQADYYPGDLGSFAFEAAGGKMFQFQAGAKLGKRFGPFGVFGKGRPGAITFSRTTFFEGFDRSNIFNPILLSHVGRSTYFSMDVGGVLEFYPSPRIIARFDCGDTMIRYSKRPIPGFPGTIEAPSALVHQLQFSAGVGFRF